MRARGKPSAAAPFWLTSLSCCYGSLTAIVTCRCEAGKPPVSTAAGRPCWSACFPQPEWSTLFLICVAVCRSSSVAARPYDLGLFQDNITLCPTYVVHWCMGNIACSFPYSGSCPTMPPCRVLPCAARPLAKRTSCRQTATPTRRKYGRKHSHQVNYSLCVGVNRRCSVG